MNSNILLYRDRPSLTRSWFRESIVATDFATEGFSATFRTFIITAYGGGNWGLRDFLFFKKIKWGNLGKRGFSRRVLSRGRCCSSGFSVLLVGFIFQSGLMYGLAFSPLKPSAQTRNKINKQTKHFAFNI